MKHVLKFLEDSGHSEYCDRKVGPPNETWLEPQANCTCGFDDALVEVNVSLGVVRHGTYWVHCPSGAHSYRQEVKQDHLQSRVCGNCGNPAIFKLQGTTR